MTSWWYGGVSKGNEEKSVELTVKERSGNVIKKNGW